MMGRNSTFLGLAVGDRTIACVELSVTGERRSIRRTATFVLPADLSLEKPHGVGQALTAFLRQNRFGSTRAVVGIPARWLVALEKELPPADPESARASLRLQAERLAVSESGELVFDFTGKTQSSLASRVLLVGTLKQRLENIERVMDAAGLHVIAVTSTGLALAACVKEADSDGAIVLLSRAGAEMVWRESGAPRMLRHVTLAMNGHGTAPIGPLAAELRRAMTLTAGNGQKNAELLILNGIGLPGADLLPLADRMGLRLGTDRDLSVLGITSDLPHAEGAPSVNILGEYGAAAALAIAGAQPTLLPLDFRHSKLAPPRVRKVDRRVILGAVLGVISLVGIVMLYMSVQQRQRDLDELDTQLTSQKPQIDEAKATVDRVNFSQEFFDKHRPQLLEGLRQITLSFRDDERVWVTNFTMRDNGKGTLAGKASDRRLVLDLVDRLKKNKRFIEFKLLETHDADTRSREVAFTMSFTFNFVE